jgi:hypothetical protein
MNNGFLYGVGAGLSGTAQGLETGWAARDRREARKDQKEFQDKSLETQWAASQLAANEREADRLSREIQEEENRKLQREWQSKQSGKWDSDRESEDEWRARQAERWKKDRESTDSYRLSHLGLLKDGHALTREEMRARERMHGEDIKVRREGQQSTERSRSADRASQEKRWGQIDELEKRRIQILEEKAESERLRDAWQRDMGSAELSIKMADSASRRFSNAARLLLDFRGETRAQKESNVRLYQSLQQMMVKSDEIRSQLMDAPPEARAVIMKSYDDLGRAVQEYIFSGANNRDPDLTGKVGVAIPKILGSIGDMGPGGELIISELADSMTNSIMGATKKHGGESFYDSASDYANGGWSSRDGVSPMTREDGKFGARQTGKRPDYRQKFGDGMLRDPDDNDPAGMYEPDPRSKPSAMTRDEAIMSASKPGVMVDIDPEISDRTKRALEHMAKPRVSMVRGQSIGEEPNYYKIAMAHSGDKGSEPIAYVNNGGVNGFVAIPPMDRVMFGGSFKPVQDGSMWTGENVTGEAVPGKIFGYVPARSMSSKDRRKLEEVVGSPRGFGRYRVKPEHIYELFVDKVRKEPFHMEYIIDEAVKNGDLERVPKGGMYSTYSLSNVIAKRLSTHWHKYVMRAGSYSKNYGDKELK